jgi:uncharacterized protein YbjT (DUF2867 family)
VATRPGSASHGDVARGIEDAVRESGMAWTILRPGGFHSYAYAWAESVRAERTVSAPLADIGLPTSPRSPAASPVMTGSRTSPLR